MSEEVLIVVRAEDQATPTVRKANSAVKEAGSSARRAGEDAARGSSGWVTAGNATDKAGTKARDASGKFLKAGSAAAASGASASRGASGFTRLGASMDAAQRKTVGFGKAYREALDERTTGRIDLVGAALVGAFGAAAWAAANFDKELSSLRAVTGATGAEMDSLRMSALQAGADTAFSASEAAIAQTELAKAGVTTADILGGALSGSLDLAAAGGVELGRAAEIAASSMNMFGLAGRDVSMIADTLASGANKSAAGVDDLAQALSMGGTVASMMGMNVQDTVGVLSMFADAGIKGSDAGTMLKTALMRLTPQSDEAAAAMEELGFSAYDSQGNFVGMSNVAGQLQSSLGKLSAEEKNAYLTTIFGQDAYRAAAILMEQGASKVDDYTAAMHDQGAAARMASTMMDNLAGDLEALKGSIETNLIKGGTGANGVLRAMTKRTTDAVNAVGALPEPIIATGFAVTALAGGFLLLAPRIAATKAALTDLKITGQGAASALKSIGKGLAIGVTATLITAATTSALAAKGELDGILQRLEDIRAELERPTDTTSLRSIAEEFKDTARAAQEARDAGNLTTGGGLFTFFSQGLQILMSGRNVYDDYNTVIDETTKQHANYLAMLGDLAWKTGLTNSAAAELADTYVAQGNRVDLINGNYHEIADSIATFSRETLAGASAVDEMKAAQDRAALSVQRLAMELAAASGWLSQRDAVRGYKAAVDEAEAAAKKNGKTLDNDTKKGRANAAALDAIAVSAGRAYTSKAQDGTITVKNTGKYEAAARAYYQQARAMGASAKEAGKLTKNAFGATTAADALAKVKGAPKIDKAKVDDAKTSLGEAETKAKDAGTAIGETKTALTNLDGTRATVYIDVVRNMPPGSLFPQAGGVTFGAPSSAGDTASPKATGGNLARTLARHAQISAGMAGMRITNALIGGGGHGRGSGDHQAGRAIDVQGPRLGDYVRRVREAGGFAELHGTGGDRHAHAVMGDTASPRSGSAATSGVNVTVPVQVIGSLHADEITGLQDVITSAVGPAVSRWNQQRRERGK